MTKAVQAHTHGSTSTSSPDEGGSFAILLFFLVLLLPISFELGGLRLSPLRLFLLAGAVPLMIGMLQGRGGRITSTDIFILLYAAWLVISLAYNHGAERVPLGIATASETISSYFLARILVRSPNDYRQVFKYGLLSMIFLFPFALYELFTGTIVIAKAFDPIFDVIFRGQSADGRLGLERVYAVFGHPILFGLYCGVMVANLYVILDGSVLRRFLALALTVSMTFMALSSAPLLAVAVQVIMLVWWRLTNGAWMTLAILCICAYVTVDLVSDRAPIEVLFAYATFNPRSGWIRIAIFEAASQAALDNPIFGIGFNPFPRPNWVPNSVDNFWVLIAMRHGFPALGFLVVGILMHFYAVMRAKLTDPVLKAYRVGHLISLIGVLFTLVTVHVWDAAYAFIIFLLGAGSWFYTKDHITAEPSVNDHPKRKQALEYTRFTENRRGVRKFDDNAAPAKQDSSMRDRPPVTSKART